jgi:pimeloyl-ACP methyl ester carboxylesterase
VEKPKCFRHRSRAFDRRFGMTILGSILGSILEPTRIALAALIALTTAWSAGAEIQPFPPSFRVQDIATDGATIHVRVGGQGPAVVLLHGFGDTGDMWAPVAAALMPDHTVVVPDLRGMGLSSHPEAGYDKKTQARDIAQVLDKLNIEKAAFVTHDIGNMVGYAFAAQFPARVTRWVVIDAPLPGIGPWDEILRNPLLWHFNFRGPDAERLVQGRERIYLDRFWNELSADPKAIDEATRRHYAELYARPGAMHSAFNQFAAFTQDASDNKAFAAAGKLNMPVLALGADHSFGTQMADVMRFVATDVTGGVIADSGHWVMEEQPKQTTAAIVDFIDKK